MSRPEKNDFIAIGLMSGTSMDGVDLACLKTDGYKITGKLGGLFVPFDDEYRSMLTHLMKRAKAVDGLFDGDEVNEATTKLMTYYKMAIDQFCHNKSMSYGDVDLVGIHGQTLYHAPQKGLTWQISDGAWLSRELGVRVIEQFRLEDVAAGGEGAPLLPVYHHALAQSMVQTADLSDHDYPVVMLNLGGVSNLTYLSKGADHADLIAFDCGPANALIDQAMLEHFNQPFDKGGETALKGTIDDKLVKKFQQDAWFDVKPPKSLDRHHFDPYLDDVRSLSPKDQIATLTMLSVVAVEIALKHLPERAKVILVVGGGAKNDTMLRWLADRTGAIVKPYPDNADLVEAEGFAFMAVRSLLGLPITFPKTTKAPQPLTGGRLHQP